ncbi:MAG TPA: Uma2 family endonuclease [Phycisphaerae bacterium]|jgi:Uma2 family endonuclease
MSTLLEKTGITAEQQNTSTGTLADLMHRLGDVPLERIRTDPPPGMATEADVERIASQEKRYFELVDGVLVEKTVGVPESLLASVVIQFMRNWLATRKLGIVLAPDGLLKLYPGTVRGPDVSFISGTRLAGGRVPREQLPLLTPDLAVEILSPSNTKKEMDRKRREYFKAGTRLVWEIDPQTRTATVYTDPENLTLLKEDQSLDGGEVLPGFSLSLRELFGELDAQYGPTGQ